MRVSPKPQASSRKPGNGRARAWLEALLVAVVAAGLLAGCRGGTGKEPLNLRLEADTDSTVKVIWSVPIDATPDKWRAG
jgi:hypothetical protein